MPFLKMLDKVQFPPNIADVNSDIITENKKALSKSFKIQYCRPNLSLATFIDKW